MSAHLTTKNLNPKTPNKILKPKRTRYIAYHWQKKSVRGLKLGTLQVKKGGEEKVNRGRLRTEKG
jgi:hypothetical protein